MNAHFLFLELLNKEICALLLGLREIFNERKSKSNIHITVRGPYMRRPTERDIRPIYEVVKNDSVKIGGVGMFENQDFYVVYLSVATQNLRKIWWKPDYPIKDFEFNPHISIYSGKDAELACKIKAFLKQENLELNCVEFELTPYASWQFCLLQDEQRRFQKHFLRLVLSRHVKGDILERAAALMEEHRKSHEKKAN